MVADVVPFLGYEDCAAAADWLVRVFGFEEIERIDEEGTVTHVTLRVGDGLIFLGHPGDAYMNPLHQREQSEAVARMYSVPWIVDGVWIAVDDIDAHHELASRSGARILSEPADTPHGRQYRVEDHEGHRWMFGSKADR